MNGGGKRKLEEENEKKIKRKDRRIEECRIKERGNKEGNVLVSRRRTRRRRTQRQYLSSPILEGENLTQARKAKRKPNRSRKGRGMGARRNEMKGQKIPGYSIWKENVCRAREIRNHLKQKMRTFEKLYLQNKYKKRKRRSESIKDE